MDLTQKYNLYKKKNTDFFKLELFQTFLIKLNFYI